MLVTQQRKLQMKTRNQLKSLPRVTITGDSLSSGINEKGL